MSHDGHTVCNFVTLSCKDLKEVHLWFCFPCCFKCTIFFTPSSHQLLVLLVFVFKGSSKIDVGLRALLRAGFHAKPKCMLTHLLCTSCLFQKYLVICWLNFKDHWVKDVMWYWYLPFFLFQRNFLAKPIYISFCFILIQSDVMWLSKKRNVHILKTNTMQFMCKCHLYIVCPMQYFMILMWYCLHIVLLLLWIN